MPKSNRSISRKPKLDNSVGIVEVDVSGVFDLGGQFEPHTEYLTVVLKSTVKVSWEYESGNGNEFFHAEFTSAQLFKAAAEAGLLTTTTSGSQRVPRGLSNVQRLIERPYLTGRA